MTLLQQLWKTLPEVAEHCGDKQLGYKVDKVVSAIDDDSQTWLTSTRNKVDDIEVGKLLDDFVELTKEKYPEYSDLFKGIKSIIDKHAFNLHKHHANILLEKSGLNLPQ